MSTVLALSIVAAAGWLLVTLVGSHRRKRSTSTTSMAGFSRALGALDPAKDARRPPAMRRARSRPPPRTRRRPHGTRQRPHRPRRPSSRSPARQRVAHKGAREG